MGRSSFALCALALWSLPVSFAHAGDMDLALSRLRIAAGEGTCTGAGVDPVTGYCPDNPAFERLVSELATTVAPAVARGAASLGARGFYVGVSSTLTSISGGDRYWSRGTAGANATSFSNSSPDPLLAWNRVELRKGLPFGLEVGSSLGQGIDTSMWIFSGELKWAIFEGFRRGLGHLPDISLHGALQSMLGSRQLSLQTQMFDVTISKPFVLSQRYRVTPFAALAALFTQASTGRVDLTPDVDALAACAPKAGSGATSATDSGLLHCSNKSSTDAANTVAFDPVSQTRVRVFAGAEGSESYWTASASVGFDLVVPNVHAGPGLPSDLNRQISVHLSLGLRY